MLLTLKPSQQPGYANPYALSPAQRSPSSYYSSPPKSASLPPLPDSKPQRMSTPHRGLPPPSVMERNLPLPERAQQTSGLDFRLPVAPTQWQGREEEMRSWLHAKSEEDRKRQEEEKTKQEELKLQQRKVEQTMLQDSLRGGVPPPMVPMIFASIGGGNVANMGVEWAQHYMAQITLQQQAQVQQQHVQQQQQQQLQAPSQAQASPDQRRDTRMITGPNPNPYGAQQMQPPAQSNPAQQPQQIQPPGSYTPSYSNATLTSERARPQQPLQAAPPTSNPRPLTTQSSLSRLNTGDMHQAAPAGTSALQLAGQHPLQQTQSTQSQDQPSSPLYFHHWQPPDQSGKSKDKEQGTPSGNSKRTSPNNQHPDSHLRSEYTTSPKKRKLTGSHQAAPTPSSHTSPSFSRQGSSGSTSGRRRRHSRASDTSTHSNPRVAHGSSRQSFSETENGRSSAHHETRHGQQYHHPAGSDSREIRHLSRDPSERNSPKREL